MTEEEARSKVLSDWEEQCQKLEAAGYTLDEKQRTPSGVDETLLIQLYIFDKEEGRDFLNDLVLGLCSGAALSLTQTRGQLKGRVFEARDERFSDLHWQARKTYARNYEAVEEMARSPFLDDASLHEWMGMSRAFPSDSRLSEDEGKSGKIGTAPSLKTLWQISASIGLHPALFLTDEHMTEAVQDLAELDPEERDLDKAKQTIEDAEDTWDRFDVDTDHNKSDHVRYWLDLIEKYPSKIDCGSPGGIVGARLGIMSTNASTLDAMTRFGHYLGETITEAAPDWLVSVNPFETSEWTNPMRHTGDIPSPDAESE